MEGSSSGTSSVEVFGMRDVLYAEVDYHQNPHGEGFLCDAAYCSQTAPSTRAFWMSSSTAIPAIR